MYVQFWSTTTPCCFKSAYRAREGSVRCGAGGGVAPAEEHRRSTADAMEGESLVELLFDITLPADISDVVSESRLYFTPPGSRQQHVPSTLDKPRFFEVHLRSRPGAVKRSGDFVTYVTDVVGGECGVGSVFTAPGHGPM